MMEDALLLYVREHGDKPTDYDRDVFGLDEEGITHVLNFFDNGGCYFVMQNKVCCDIDLSSIESERDLYNLTCNEFTHYAFQCLYIVKYEDGTESLNAKAPILANGTVTLSWSLFSKVLIACDWVSG